MGQFWIKKSGRTKNTLLAKCYHPTRSEEAEDVLAPDGWPETRVVRQNPTNTVCPRCWQRRVDHCCFQCIDAAISRLANECLVDPRPIGKGHEFFMILVRRMDRGEPELDIRPELLQRYNDLLFHVRAYVLRRQRIRRQRRGWAEPEKAPKVSKVPQACYTEWL